MSNKLKTITKPRKNQKQITKSFKQTANRLKWCSCSHLVAMHDMDVGCTQVVEDSDAEDHWVCGCKDVVSIHINAYQKQRKAARR